ncbi:sensor histidine kinase [Roseitranquillus sediminis]|uniref:sensor histidine kinase n=1 Tax=Roseitranquillus sediminis TaxID=2809051 RepID=UPI001D0C595E|nr:HAMP domain-containing sensor histidine kinase [Roseitranquillus sediminis]MBM9594570.1 HAMP domain-containing histidine kinase [Roseitranquillus sediminis]
MSTAAKISTLFSRCYWHLTEYFLPDHVAGKPEATNQARMFLLSHFLGPCFGLSAPLALYLLDPTPGFEILVLAASILSFWVFPFPLKWGVSYRKLVMISIAVDWFAIYWACFHFGGAHSPTLIWILIIPVLSVFYIGGDRRMTRDLLLLGAASSLVFMAVYVVFEPPTNDIPTAALKVLGAVSAFAVMCYVSVMAIYYARIFDAGADLEQEVARRKMMTAELQRSLQAADRAASAKSEFLARMSHELRSPLNAIVGYGELLRESCSEDGDRMLDRDLGRILEAGDYLTRLIDRILTLAKIDSGKMRFNPKPHDLAQVIEEVISGERELIETNGNRVTVSVAPETSAVVIDHMYVVQIIASIVKNAAIHTRDGAISIATEATRLGNKDAIKISVSDTGCGIAQDVLPVIFETFLTEREAAAGRYGGTGLALAVTSKLCQAMGGQVTAESVEGEGSTFHVTLPKRTPATPPMQAQALRLPMAA